MQCLEFCKQNEHFLNNWKVCIPQKELTNPVTMIPYLTCGGQCKLSEKGEQKIEKVQHKNGVKNISTKITSN